MGSGSEADEELTAVGGRAAVGHRQDTGTRVLELRVELVLELAAPERLTTSTVAELIVAALQHEAGDDTVEDDVVVLASISEACEVLTCLY